MSFMKNREQTSKVLRELVELLDIPPSYYQKAVDRYKSMADHFHRPQSTIRHLEPLVHPQGSFRLGTVIRPLLAGEGYDLDLVCRVLANKKHLSQKDLKEIIGVEVMSYSREQAFKEAPIDKRRCWTQQYQDEVDFHMDILPSIPAGDRHRRLLLEAGVARDLVEQAINITDKTESNYAHISPDWPRSNPRGFALWFEERMDVGGLASSSRRTIFESRGGVYDSVDDVPVYELKTPLQRVVQLLKRHRDQRFKDDPDGKPISVIITTLAARAYNGEANLGEAMAGVLERMGDHVSSAKPRIPNPVSFDRDDTMEDFADRWDARLEANFWRWLRQAKEDFGSLGRAASASQLTEATTAALGLSLSQDAAKASLGVVAGVPAVVGVAKVAKTAPPSWGTR